MKIVKIVGIVVLSIIFLVLWCGAMSYLSNLMMRDEDASMMVSLFFGFVGGMIVYNFADIAIEKVKR